MINPIKQICKFNKDAGLLGKDFDDTLEASFLIEEALEGFDRLDTLMCVLMGTDVSDITAEDCAKQIVSIGHSGLPIADVDRLDKACDAVIYAVGSMAKLGLDSNQITLALNAVMAANNAKLEMSADSRGKLQKPKDFKGPEEALQAILDRR